MQHLIRPANSQPTGPLTSICQVMVLTNTPRTLHPRSPIYSSTHLRPMIFYHCHNMSKLPHAKFMRPSVPDVHIATHLIHGHKNSQLTPLLYTIPKNITHNFLPRTHQQNQKNPSAHKERTPSKPLKTPGHPSQGS